MNKVISSERFPVKMWLPDAEKGAISQIKNAVNLPFVFRHIACMPDMHQGYGIPIGTVLPVRDVVIPNAVGVDIGCGMVLCKSNLRIEDFADEWKKKIVMAEIRKRIPVGFAGHQKLSDDIQELIDEIKDERPELFD